MTLGRPRLHLRATTSTNDRARALAEAGAPHGTLVTAGEQTRGRGRQGRTWVGPPGRALLLSLLVREYDDLLPLRGGLAVADVAGAEARVKWPNDVLLAGRKLAGILVEARPAAGVGDPRDRPQRRGRSGRAARPTCAIWPARWGGRRAALEPTLGELLGALETRLAEPAPESLDALRARDALLGKPVRWATGAGVGAGIDDGGALLVRLPDGRVHTLSAGEVHLGPS